MSITDFTVEESHMIAIYKRDKRKETIQTLIGVSRFFEDIDMKHIAGECISKLNKLTDKEYERIKFTTK